MPLPLLSLAGLLLADSEPESSAAAPLAKKFSSTEVQRTFCFLLPISPLLPGQARQQGDRDQVRRVVMLDVLVGGQTVTDRQTGNTNNRVSFLATRTRSCLQAPLSLYWRMPTLLFVQTFFIRSDCGREGECVRVLFLPFWKCRFLDRLDTAVCGFGSGE